jgi:3-methyladenine DNA glycosylase/8-oxoguanine DNA glycosylase
MPTNASKIQPAAGDETKARQVLIAFPKSTVKSHSGLDWKLYALLVSPDTEPSPDDIKRVNEFFKRRRIMRRRSRALKEVADYYASSRSSRRSRYTASARLAAG